MTRITIYRPVNRCIYCGTEEDLGDEHIVPYSLGGMSFLPAASCRKCEAVTSAFEGRCASVNYGSFRVRENVQTRNPKRRPKHLRMTSTEEGIESVHLVLKEGAIATMPVFRFRPPGYLVDPMRKEIGWAGATFELKTDPPRQPELWKSYKAPSFSVTQRFDPDSHARLLAKIAHALAIGHLGLDGFEPWLPPYILGHDQCLSYLVGGFVANEEPLNVLHEIKYEVWPADDRFIVLVKLRLFAQFGGPHTQVVVGTSTTEMLNRRRPYAIEGNA
jgi:hypothetical protein